MIDAKKIKQDFPILFQTVNDEPLIYLDNAATSQKPKQVLEAIQHYYEHDNANIHRGVHTLAERATSAYEAAREKLRRFINAASEKEVLFTRGTTTGLNWVAVGFGDLIVEEGDEIYITPMEHHSNVVPWQQLAKRKQAKLVYLPLTEDGFVDVEKSAEVITAKGKILSVCHSSNVLGVTNPIKELAALIHQHNGYIVVDGAQSTPHMKVDVQALDADFYAFSGHKMLGPTGSGVLYGKEALLEKMEPVEFGGEMIDFVYDQESTWSVLPWKFEAGTPNIAGGIGLGSAVDYLEAIGMDAIEAYEKEMVRYVLPKLQAIEGITVYGPAGRPDMFYYSATQKLVKGETISIFNYGNCRRDFTYVDDIVEGVLRVMRGAPEKATGEDSLPLPPYAVYNIGGGTPENLLDYISTLQEELVRAGVLSSDYDFEGHCELVGMQPGDVPVTYADSTGLERDYGFRPSIGIREGLRRFAQWYAGYYMNN